MASDGSVHDPKLAPGIVIVHSSTFALFTVGEVVTRATLEPFGEDGDPTRLALELADDPEVRDVAWLTARDAVSYEEAPLLPGASVQVDIELGEDAVEAGDRVTVAAMFGESNDTVVAALSFDPFEGEPVDGAALLAGEIPLQAYDLGTEVDQEPGLGADQAPRQAAPGEGEAESVPVEVVTDGHDGFAWLPVESYARLTAGP